MHVLGIVAGSETAALADRLAARLDGRVGFVHAGAPGPAGRTTYELGPDGWTAAGPGLDLGDALDRLAREHDYALVAGFPEARIPHLVVGDREVGGEPLVTAESAEAVDPDAVVDALAATEPRETLGSLVARAKCSPDAERAGAIATFTGRVRAKDSDDDARTTHLEFEKYEGVAEQRLATIREQLEGRDGVYEVLLHHRTGVVSDGEDIVFVVVLAGHREEAFRTVEDGINRLKDEVPLFKKEITVDDEFWVHEHV